MPVILTSDAYDLWLDPGMQRATAAADLLKPFDADLMRSNPVSTRLNSVANDDAKCALPSELTERQSILFSWVNNGWPESAE
jgi:putative SOS response-associated peptidase YedK